MWITLLRLLLPFAFNVVSKYVASSDSKKDDVILDIVKNTSKYMSLKDNNTLSIDTASAIALAKIKKVSK